ncbi:hypothetical protein [Kocuria atrinae]|uniref:hypothetical protein n=1 Tax=Kocuria atrinae TaxID=592377 RepID=UPI0002E22CC8|nr:hypothetical protein [Kocuria atrinae]
MEPFVTADWLQEHRDSVVLADARMYLDGRSARAAYLQGHLPGAVFVDVSEALAAPASPEAAAIRSPHQRTLRRPCPPRHR